jgi:predicted porin
VAHLKVIAFILGTAVASGGAAAQTAPAASYTLYGVVDTAVEWAEAGLGSVTSVQSGGMMGSRFGLRGVEDLGGGLRASFTIEGGFGSDTGTLQQGGRAWGRQSWVGLGGAWGELTLGRQYSPQFWAFSRTDAFELGLSGGLPVISRTRTAGTSTTVAGLLSSYVTTGRTDNSVVYTSPLLGGFRGRGMVGLGEVAGTDRSGLTWGASGHYTAGALDANVGYTTRRDSDGFGDMKVLSVGASYALGAARVFVGHTRDSSTVASTATVAAPKTEYALTNVGVRYRFASSTTTAIAQYTRINDRSAGLTASRDGDVFALGAVHDLSIRTALYASVGLVTNQNGSNYSLGGGLWLGTPAGNDKDAKSIIIGIRHLF